MRFSVFLATLNCIGGLATTSVQSAAYFVNWAVYARKFTPAEMPSDQLTHVLYAFADVHINGTVYLTDTYADTELQFPNDPPDESGRNVHGCVRQLFALKQQNRNLKVLLSIGGWTYSSNFSTVASSPTTRSAFAHSAVGLVEQLGFDGIDVDWEFPSTDKEGRDFTQLLQECRAKLDAAALERCSPTTFYLSVAASAGPSHYQHLDVSHVDQLVDFWNLMAYDFVGIGSAVSGYTANLYPSNYCPSCTPYSASEAVTFYVDHGATSSKILLGIPLYGRAFQDTVPGQPFNGIGAGSWEDGIWDYKVLPRPGSHIIEDTCAVASWSYDTTNKTMIVFDDEDVVQTKAEFVMEHGLGGAAWWESSGDKPSGKGSLIETFYARVGQLEQRQNCLEYPQSIYDNIRLGSDRL